MPPALHSNEGFSKKLALALVNMIALAYVAVLGKRVLCPLIFAFLFSLLLLPFAKFLEAKLRFKRSLAALVAVIVLEVLLAIFFYFIASRANDLIKDWPELSHGLSVTFDTIQQWISSSLHIDLNKQEQYIHNVSSKVLSAGTSALGQTVASFLLFYVLMTFYLFFILLYRALLLKFFIEAFRKKAVDTI